MGVATILNIRVDRPCFQKMRVASVTDLNDVGLRPNQPPLAKFGMEWEKSWCDEGMVGEDDGEG